MKRKSKKGKRLHQDDAVDGLLRREQRRKETQQRVVLGAVLVIATGLGIWAWSDWAKRSREAQQALDAVLLERRLKEIDDRLNYSKRMGQSR